jgi:hypothetical protein
MHDSEKVIKGLECHADVNCVECPYRDGWRTCSFGDTLLSDAIALLKKQDKEIKALRLLVEWAEECDFGFDQFPEEYERYKDEIKDMKYIDGMVHVAKRTLEDHGAFEEGL